MVQRMQVSICSTGINRIFTYLMTRGNAKFVLISGKRKCFHIGGTLSNQFHICQHFEAYKTACAMVVIPMNHHAIPRVVWKEMQEEAMPSGGKQSTLVFAKMNSEREFTRKAVLHSVAQFVACENQVSIMQILSCCTSDKSTGPHGCKQGDIQELPCHHVTKCCACRPTINT